MTKKSLWNNYIGKKVKLIVEDVPYPRPREGIFVGMDETHIFLQTEFKEKPIPFSRNSVKRVELLE